MLFACGGEDRPISTAEQAPQQLVIPPMDAGEQPVVGEAPVATPPPKRTEPKANANEIPERDKRLARSSVRSPSVVSRMIQGTEQAIAGMPPNDPKAVTMLKLVADLYEELATLSPDDEPAARAARQKEADHLLTLINNFPAYSLLDEARYYRALTCERLGDLRNARATYFDLIKSHPSSKYIPGAYFAFGEIFFVESKADPSKWDLANQAFLETIKYPPPGNALFPYALLRLGEVAHIRGDTAKAKSYFDRLRHDSPNSPAVQRIP